MAQSTPEQEPTLDLVLELVSQLGPDDRDKVVKELKLQWLRRQLQTAEDQLERGECIPAEDVLSELKLRAEERLRKRQQ